MRKAAVTVSLCALCLAAPAQETPKAAVETPVAELVDPVASLRDQRLSGASVAGSGKSFEIGGGTYSFSSGTLWQIVAKDGSAVGAFFEGQGRLTWAAGEPSAARVYADNAKRVGGIEIGRDNQLEASFGRAAFFFSPAARPDLGTFSAAAAPPGEALTKLRQRFGADRLPSPEAGLAAAGPDGRYFAALVVAGKDLRHEVDDVLGAEESLSVVERPSGTPSTFPDWRFARAVGRRPVGRERRALPRPHFKLVDVAVDVRETDGGHGLLSAEETLLVERPIRAAALSLVSEELTPRIYSVVPTRMGSVTGEDGRPVPFVFEKNRVVVFFGEPLSPGTRKTLTFRYDGGYFARVGGDNYWELPLGGSWYPQPLPLEAASLHTFRAVVRAKKPFLAFASGETVRRAEEGGWNLLETKLTRPVRFATILAGKYTVQEDTQDGVTCRVASYGVSKEKSGARLTNLFHKIRRFYEPYFGPFPWKEYTIVEINDYGFGQAPPGMMRITGEAFQANVLGDEVAAFFSGGINERLAHEIAHSWWGYVVWSGTRADSWIDEAFAEAAAGRAIEVLKDKGDFRRLENIWRTRAKDASRIAPVFLANDTVEKLGFFSSDDLFEHRFYLTYFKGATLLQAIRKDIGDDAFFTILKSFLRSFEKKSAVTTADFIGLLNYVTKKDWKPWFEKYYYGFEMP